jgi:xanthine dehydrogenase YagR molybdenum-binding subunit
MPGIGPAYRRIEARLKVTGRADFTADVRPPSRLAHAAMVTSPIPRGRIASIEVDAAERAPGVLGVLSHRNAPRLPYAERSPQRSEPDSGRPERVLQGDEIVHQGQCVALVVAETSEDAAHAAGLVRVEYVPATAPASSFGETVRAGATVAPSKAAQEEAPAETRRGDVEAALATAATRGDVVYDLPRLYHCSMEPFATVAAWDGDRLTVWDKSQWVSNHQEWLASVFGIPVDHVRVISRFVGGGFGAGGRVWPHVDLTALAARVIGRPVKLALTRRQHCYGTGYRPRTRQRLTLGVDGTGRLVALRHFALQETSRYEEYTENILGTSGHLYACPNVHTRLRLVPLDTNTPTAMRAPGFESGLLALECALDEMAAAAGLDPLELRLRNYAERDASQDLPYSSKALRECYRAGAERFGWHGRPRQPGAMRRHRELIGWGMATAHFPTFRMAASARARLRADGSAVVSSGTEDMGPGTYTSMAQIGADTLGLALEQVSVELGDSVLPRAPIHSGSMTTASVGSAVYEACRALRLKVMALARGDRGSPLQGVSADELRVADGRVFVAGDPERGERYADIMGRHGESEIAAEVESAPGDEEKTYSMHGFGAVFAEVGVDPDLGRVQVRRLVGAWDIGRVLNPQLARSQAIGGMTMGIGMALLEGARLDERSARVTTADLAHYLVPVHADVPSGSGLEVMFVGEPDLQANPLGVKGFGELAMSGTAPAIVNAVFHATGKRVRTLPLTPDQLL